MDRLVSFLLNNIIFRNVVAVIIGLIIGAFSNMGILLLGMKILPLPEGVDINRVETIAANIDKYTISHYVNVFLAHGLGTFFGAFICAKLAKSKKLVLSMVIGALFLYGGIEAVRMIPAPWVFNIIDLVGAYIPMAWLGYTIASRRLMNS